jgi:hypothetical protein
MGAAASGCMLRAHRPAYRKSTTAVVPGKHDGARTQSGADPGPILTGRDSSARYSQCAYFKHHAVWVPGLHSGDASRCRGLAQDDSRLLGNKNCTTGSLGMRDMRQLPVGLLCRRSARLRRRANQTDALAHPASSKRGVRVVTIRGVRGAMDVEAALDVRALTRTAKSCGPDIPTLISSRRWCSHHADDGGQKARRTEEITYKP